VDFLPAVVIFASFGPLVDRFHALRVLLIGVSGVAVTFFAGFFLVQTPISFLPGGSSTRRCWRCLRWPIWPCSLHSSRGRNTASSSRPTSCISARAGGSALLCGC